MIIGLAKVLVVSMAVGDERMTPGDAEVGDILMVHGLHTGEVVGKFLSATGEEVYDIKLVCGPSRVAALEDHIVINYGPRANFT